MSSIVQKTDGSMEPMSDAQEGLKIAAADLLAAIEAKNPSQIASAIQAAFDICGSSMDFQGEGE